MRYDITVRGDSVSLADINWVYPTLPTTGGGSMVLHIGNNEENPDVLEYALKDMDVRSTSSHLIGNMTFGGRGAGADREERCLTSPGSGGLPAH